MQCFKVESRVVVTNKTSALKPNVYQCRCGPSPQCRLRELIWTCQCIPEGVSTITHIFSCHFVATLSCLLEICLLARFYSPNYFALTNNNNVRSRSIHIAFIIDYTLCPSGLCSIPSHIQP